MTSLRTPGIKPQQLASPWSRDALRRSLAIGSAVIVPLAIALLVAVVLVRRSGGEASSLLRDPVAVGNLPTYVGLFSNLGILIWSLAAGAALLAGVAIHRLLTPGHTTSDHGAEALLVGGALTLLLAVDDLFLLHENVLPALGIPDQVPMVGYMVAAGLWVWRYRVALLRGQSVLLVLAGMLLLLSAVIDNVIDIVGVSTGVGLVLVLEDSCKFFGIALWSVFLVDLAVRSLNVAAMRPRDVAASLIEEPREGHGGGRRAEPGEGAGEGLAVQPGRGVGVE